MADKVGQFAVGVYAAGVGHDVGRPSPESNGLDSGYRLSVDGNTPSAETHETHSSWL